MLHPETEVYILNANEARRVVPQDPEQQKFTGDAMYTIMNSADVTGMSYVGGPQELDEVSMRDCETNQEFTILRKGWEADVRYGAEGYVRVAGIVESTLKRSPVTIVIS